MFRRVECYIESNIGCCTILFHRIFTRDIHKCWMHSKWFSVQRTPVERLTFAFHLNRAKLMLLDLNICICILYTITRRKQGRKRKKKEVEGSAEELCLTKKFFSTSFRSDWTWLALVLSHMVGEKKTPLSVYLYPLLIHAIATSISISILFLYNITG